MRRAAKVDANQESIVDALRKAGAAILSLAPMGRGVPDLLIGHRGSKRIGYVEIKNPERYGKKRELRDKQIEFWDDWQGFPMALVTDIESALRFYRMLGGDYYAQVNAEY